MTDCTHCRWFRTVALAMLVVVLALWGARPVWRWLGGWPAA